MLMPMARLFFAVQSTRSQQLAMQAAARSLLLPQSAGRLVPAVDLHVTLCFLAEVEARDMDPLVAAATTVRPALLQLELTDADWWPRSQVLCLVPEPAAPAVRELAALAEQLRAVAATAGVVPDDKPFRPHVTVARKVAAGATRAGLWPQRLQQPLRFTANGFALLRSTGRGDGPRYAVHHAWPCVPLAAHADAKRSPES